MQAKYLGLIILILATMGHSTLQDSNILVYVKRKKWFSNDHTVQLLPDLGQFRKLGGQSVIVPEGNAIIIFVI